MPGEVAGAGSAAVVVFLPAAASAVEAFCPNNPNCPSLPSLRLDTRCQADPAGQNRGGQADRNLARLVPRCGRLRPECLLDHSP